MFGAVFMATDPVSAAQTERGKWIYGFLNRSVDCTHTSIQPRISRGDYDGNTTDECVCSTYRLLRSSV